MKIQYLFLSLFLLSSCSSDIERNVESDGTIEKIHVNLEDFKNEEGSRTNITTDAGGVHYVWAKTDTIGIFPSEGKQVEFPMSEGAGSQSATFSGGGWGLKRSSTYAAYCPLIGQYYLDKTKIPVDYTGQVQDGNNSTTHLGKYDYLAAPASGVENGTVSFNFKRLGCVARLEIPIPESGDVTSVTLSCDQPIFTEQGTFNLNSSSPQITSEKPSKTFSIELKNVTTTAAKEKAIVYFMTSPLQMTGKVVKATVINNGVEYTGTVESKDMTVGTAYRLPVTLDEQKPIQNVYHVATAGTLPLLIGEENKFKITELKLTGELNGTDIRFIREMAGRDSQGKATNGILMSLDLNDAKIVEGGDYYYKNQSYDQTTIYTKNNILGDYIFADCSSLISVILPDGVTMIGSEAFCNCRFESITIPNSVTSIGSEAFYFCTSLTQITIPNSVTSIGDKAFEECHSLASITIPNSVTSIGSRAFCKSGLTDITIPDSITSINYEVFAECSSLESITIPNSVTSIESGAFSSCGLRSIRIPDSVTSIGSEAFYFCTSLTQIPFPNSITSIGDKAFEHCRFDDVLFQNGTTILGEKFLSSADYCRRLVLPSSLEQIRSQALPKDVKYIYCFAEEPPILYTNSGLSKTCKIYVLKSSVNRYKAASGWKDHAAYIFEMPEGVPIP